MFMTKRGRRTLRGEKEMGEKRFEKDKEREDLHVLIMTNAFYGRH